MLGAAEPSEPTELEKVAQKQRPVEDVVTGSTLIAASNRDDDVFESFRPEESNAASRVKAEALDEAEQLDADDGDGMSFAQAHSERPHEDVEIHQVKEVDDNLLESQEEKPIPMVPKDMDEDESAMDFAGEDLEETAEINKQLQQSARVARRSTMTGDGSQLEEDQEVSRSQRA